MAVTLMTRFRTIMRAEVTSLIVRFEDPEKILHQLILDMEEALGDAKRGAARAIADENRLRARCEHHEKARAEWNGHARAALERADDASARAALERAEREDEVARQLREQLTHQREGTGKLREAVRELSEKIELARRRRNLLVARLRRAQAQKAIHGTLHGIADSSALEAFERMEDRVDEIEAEADAEAELEDDGCADVLRREMADLERARRVEERLKEMRETGA